MPALIALGLIIAIIYFAISLLLKFLNYIYEILAWLAFPIANLFNNIIGINMTQLTSVGIVFILFFVIVGIILCIRYLRTENFENESVENDNKLIRSVIIYALIFACGITFWSYMNDYILTTVSEWDKEFRVIGYGGFLLYVCVIGFILSQIILKIIYFTPMGKKKREYLRELKKEAEKIKAIKNKNFLKLNEMMNLNIKEAYRRGYDSIFETAVSYGEDEGYSEGYNKGYNENC